MKKLIFIKVVFITIIIMMATIPEVMGGTITINRISGYYAGNGGEFNIVPTSPDLNWLLNNYDPKAKAGSSLGFETFCLEVNEYVSIPATYNAIINDRAINGGVGSQGDPISLGTAWLYDQFRQGLLAGYNYTPGSGRSTSAGELQNTIWWLEGEVNVQPSNSFSTAVITKFGSETSAKLDNNGTYAIAVLNLTDNSGGRHQDQVVAVPEPATLILLGSGLFALGILSRRRFKSS